MIRASDAARYFLSLSDEEAGDTISNLKLQKLLYYAQGFHLALFDAPLFGDRIEAWTHGPVVPAVYRDYKVHGAGAIPMPRDFDPLSVDGQTRELLDEVNDVYGQYSAWKLRNMTHVEPPWCDAYGVGASTPIESAAMKAYFQTLLKN
jgi:uncharacterized phage-associated protein